MIIGLTAPPRRYSNVARGLALLVAFLFAFLSYHVAHLSWLINQIGAIVVGLLICLLMHVLYMHRRLETEQLGKLPSLRGGHVAKRSWMMMLPFGLSLIIQAILIGHLPYQTAQFIDYRYHATAPIAVYWLSVAIGVGLLRYFAYTYPHRSLYEATLIPITKGVWRYRLLDYGVYMLSMSQILFYALCLSSIGMVIVSFFNAYAILIFDLDAWYFAAVLLGFGLVLSRKLPWRKIFIQMTRWQIDIRYTLLLFGCLLMMLLGLPVALSDWFQIKGWYTSLHHDYLIKLLLALFEHLGLNAQREQYLLGGLWALSFPWVMSLYYRLSEDWTFGQTILGIAISAIVGEYGFRALMAVEQKISPSVLLASCILLIIYVGLTFRNQTNQNRFVGGWLPSKARHCRPELGRLGRMTVLLLLLSVVGLWPLMQLQVLYYSLAMILVWTVISLSYCVSIVVRNPLCPQVVSDSKI